MHDPDFGPDLWGDPDSDTALFGGIGRAFKKAAKSIGKAAGSAVKLAVKPVSTVVSTAGKAVSYVPVVGGAAQQVVNLAAAPTNLVQSIASGERIDKAVLNNLKSQLKSVKALAPYAAMVASMVPGVGTGVSAAIGAATALAEGQPLSQAVVAGIKSSLPGGPLAQSAFGIAEAAVSGKPIDKIAIAALPISPQAKQGLETALSTAKAIAAGQRVDTAIADNALKVVPEQYRKAAQVGIAVAQGKKLQAGQLVSVATSAVRPLAQKELSKMTRPLPSIRAVNVIPKLKRRKLPSPFTQQADGITTLLRRQPQLRSLSAVEIARRLHTRPSTVQAVLNRLPSMPYRGLSANAAKMVRRYCPMAPGSALLNDTRGLIEGGTIYVVESGDFPGKIAKKLTGKESNWPQLIRANPQKATVDKGIGPEFKTLYAGEKLKLPQSWVTSSVTPVPSSGPAADAATVIQAKGILAAWGKTDGKNSAGITDYGSRAEDLSPGWSNRDSLMLRSFSQWSNSVRRTTLSTDGNLTTAHSTELRKWAEQAASSTVPTIPTQTTQPSQPSQPGPIVIPIPTLPTVPPATTSPSTPQIPVDILNPIPTAPTQQAAKKDEGSVLPILAGVGTGYTLGGGLGAIVGGLAGALLSGPKEANG